MTSIRMVISRYYFSCSFKLGLNIDATRFVGRGRDISRGVSNPRRTTSLAAHPPTSLPWAKCTALTGILVLKISVLSASSICLIHVWMATRTGYRGPGLVRCPSRSSNHDLFIVRWIVLGLRRLRTAMGARAKDST